MNPVMTMYDIFRKKWQQEGHLITDDRLESYWERSQNIPALKIGERLHWVFVFPSFIQGDYQVNMSGIPTV